MARNLPETWMWAEACATVARAERLHRSFFEPLHAPAAARRPSWQPPADVLETEHEVLILIALPGVDPAAVEAVIEDGALRIAGQRVIPAEWHSAAIHRLELPQGRFERRIPLPPGRYSVAIRTSLLHGCLLVRLDKAN